MSTTMHGPTAFSTNSSKKARGLCATSTERRCITNCGTTGTGAADQFTPAEWYELLFKANHMEQLITNHWQIMGEVDKIRTGA